MTFTSGLFVGFIVGMAVILIIAFAITKFD